MRKIIEIEVTTKTPNRQLKRAKFVSLWDKNGNDAVTVEDILTVEQITINAIRQPKQKEGKRGKE